jgi:hypothetical protein
MSLTFQEAAGFKPRRTCGQCLWIRDYVGRFICFKGGKVGPSVRSDQVADFCEDYEEAVK